MLLLCVWVRAWLRSGEGIGWLAADTKPNSLYRVPFYFFWHLCCVIIVPFFFSSLFCFYALVGPAVDVLLIVSCPADHVPDWQPRILLGMVEAGRPGSSEVPRNPLTRWDVSSIPANGIFLTKKLKNKIKMPNGWRTIKL